jgi:hypothetical protein
MTQTFAVRAHPLLGANLAVVPIHQDYFRVLTGIISPVRIALARHWHIVVIWVLRFRGSEVPGFPPAGVRASRICTLFRKNLACGAWGGSLLGHQNVAPLELALEITPRARFDVVDVRAQAADRFGAALEAYSRCMYSSPHTTAGYLPQSLSSRLLARTQGVGQYFDLFRTVFPEGAGYLHDQLDLRVELAPDQRHVEPTNGDSHLAFIAGGLHACVSYLTRRPGPVFFIDLDGMHAGTPRRRLTTLVGYDSEEVVARTTLRVAVSSHPINVVNLKDPGLGLYAQLTEFIARHDVTKGRVRLELASGEHNASLTVNEYETLLMQHDLAEVLRNPFRFAAEKARHAWNDPRAVPTKAIEYAKYDFVRALNQVLDALGLGATRVERMLARALEVPASRFLRMKRSVDLLVSDRKRPGFGAVVEGTYQTPIMVQWRGARQGGRAIDVTLTRFL